MNDKDIKIGFETSADTSGAEKTRDAIDDVTKAAERANKSGRSPVDKLFGEEKGGRRRRLEKTARSIGKITDKLKGLGKVGARIGGLYAIVTTAGNAFGGFLQKISKVGKGVEEFGDNMAITGQKGSRFVQWLGRGISRLDSWGEAVKRTFNPIGAWIDSTNRLADAQRKLDETMSRNLSLARARGAAARKAAAALEKERIDADKLAEASEEYIRANKAWEKSIESVSDAIRHQNDLIAEQRRGADARVDRNEQRSLDSVDRDLEDGVIGERQAEEKKLQIRRAAAIQREKIARKAFKLEQESRKKQIQAEKETARRSRSKQIGLESISEGILGEAEKGKIQEQINKLVEEATQARKEGADLATDSGRDKQQRIARELDKRVQSLRDKLTQSNKQKDQAKVLGFDDPEKLKEEIDKLIDVYEKAQIRLRELEQQGSVSRLREKNRRNEAIEDFRDLNTEGQRNISRGQRNDQREQFGRANDLLEQLAVEARASGHDRGASIAEEILSVLKDGQVTAEEAKKIAPAVKELAASNREGIGGLVGVVQQEIASLRKYFQQEMDTLRQQTQTNLRRGRR